MTRRSSMIFVKCLAAAALLSLAGDSISAATLFSDGFESYTAGTNPLDKNTAGPNAAPNGSGNPWFGPAPPNLRVVGTTGGVNPIGGSNMVTASAPSDVDQDWVNIAYRFNSGAVFTGNIELDWYFYDPAGQNGQGSSFKDMAGLAYYSSAQRTPTIPAPAASTVPARFSVLRWVVPTTNQADSAIPFTRPAFPAARVVIAAPPTLTRAWPAASAGITRRSS